MQAKLVEGADPEADHEDMLCHEAFCALDKDI
jgi:hypothetical protein